MKRSAGYSGTPLVEKLGIKEGARAFFVDAPGDFDHTLGPLPEGVSTVRSGTVDIAILFVTRFSELTKKFAQLRDRLETNGMLWVAWPKKSSGVKSDVDENLVRDFGLEAGLVDVKVCAIDETWSGLKFVRRLRDR
jgi:hypothetical protein